MKTEGEAKIAVVTCDGRLFYELLGELRRRRVAFLAKAPGEPIPLKVKAVLTSRQEEQLLTEQIGLRVKIVGCRPGEAGLAVSRALAFLHGLDGEKITVGVDPGKTIGFAAVSRGVVLEKASFPDFKQLRQAVFRLVEEWRPSKLVLKVGAASTFEGDVEAVRELESLAGKLKETFKVEVDLRLVDEAGTTVKAKRKGAKHRETDEASAVEIALKE